MNKTHASCPTCKRKVLTYKKTHRRFRVSRITHKNADVTYCATCGAWLFFVSDGAFDEYDNSVDEPNMKLS